ncbi:N-acetylmuramoyl-L-alanine amidase [Paenibacillus sp. J5C_2022]|uniref:peptidoglycan recognition protein family protein n=1 Tax=Paenibacillus sp. J5C2022 TaxID=2977129 RepID=UPI0021D1C91F|nr:N-acetylmuramoyl-L-alanine amidase [Paenibacillus sp. J5C2022]MCU6710090.1 N-acetylmuramoyl-L-alanine amidase [Paenibacillus sp. J5C2022]
MNFTYTCDHIPNLSPFHRRPALSMSPVTITIHNTGNPRSTARNERNWLSNPANDRTASYHIVIDDKEAIECIPLDEVAWHAGDGTGASSGNRTSIAIELCESGDYARTLVNAVKLVSQMLYERGWHVNRLRRHFDWSGKICPRLMYGNGNWDGWHAFMRSVQAELTALKQDDPSHQPQPNEQWEPELAILRRMIEDQTKMMESLHQSVKKLNELHKMEVPDWAKEAVEAALRVKLIDSPTGGSHDFYRLVTILWRLGLV